MTTGTYQDNVIKGSLMRAAPALDNNIQILAWAISAPIAGSFHVASANAFTEERLLPSVPLPSGFSWSDRFTFPAPNYEFPFGDWMQGSEIFEYVVSSSSQNKYKITYKLVSFKYATLMNLDPFRYGFVNLVLGTFNLLTMGLFENYMGIWVISSVKPVQSITNPSLSTERANENLQLANQFNDKKLETKTLVLAGLAAFLIYSAATAPKKLVQRIGIVGAGYTTYKIFGKK